MIQRLQLQNWRAYDALDLELGPGATFVVASNGVGKTSLIMAAAWGLFGEVSGVKGVEQIRGDAEMATVQIVLRLPTQGALTILRSIDQRGRIQVEAKMGDDIIPTAADLDSLLSENFGADVHVLAQLIFMIHGGLLETQGEFSLQDHLARVFGVTPLFEGAAESEALANEAASSLRKMKSTQRTDRRQREQLTGELTDVDRLIAALKEERGASVERMNDASDGLRLAKEWNRFQQALIGREEKLTSLAATASALLGESVSTDNLTQALSQKESELANAVSASETAAASARGKADLIRESMSQLQASDAICPTCLRPLTDHEVGQAKEGHLEHIKQLMDVVNQAEEQVGEIRDALDKVRNLLQQIRSVPVPAEPELGPSDFDVKQIEGTFELARDELQELDQKLAVHSASKRSLEQALRDLDEDEKFIKEQEGLFRQEGVALAASKAFEEAGNAITKNHIEPLVGEVVTRWKRIFGSDGLNLSPDGRITRQVGSRILPFESLSGGEKVWALLLTRLVVAGASTSAPFVWLDEPLEHLDPRLRKVVAGTLAKASSGAGLRQVIVTTYESELARQLMEDVSSASLIYVKSSE